MTAPTKTPPVTTTSAAAGTVANAPASRTAAASETSLSRAEFDKRTGLYAELGFSAERAASQLAIAGFPREWIRQRFPAVPDQALPAAPVSRSSARATARARKAIAVIDGAQGQGVPLPKSVAHTSARVLNRIATDTANAPTSASPAPAASPPDLNSIADGGIAFQYVPLIQCSFPHADPGELTSFTRRNGWLELTLSATRADTGLPYGVPARLLTIHCASEAIRTRSPEIFLGNSVNDFLRRLDIPITRGERGSQRVYANQLLRLIHCAISIDENVTDGHGRAGLHIRQALFAQEAQLWWDSDGAGQGSSLVLSPVLFESILERSAPLSTNAIKQLRKSPMDLDVYAWLVHRLFTLGKPSTISWQQLSGQFGHGYALTRKFRSYFLDSLKRVLAVYPEARVKESPNGLTLLPSKRHVAPTLPADA